MDPEHETGIIADGCSGYDPSYEDGEWPGGCVYPISQSDTGVSCCDEAWYVYGMTCEQLEQEGFYCGGCKCPGDTGAGTAGHCSWNFKPMIDNLWHGQSAGWNSTDDSCVTGCRDAICHDGSDGYLSTDGRWASSDPLINWGDVANIPLIVQEHGGYGTTAPFNWEAWSSRICAYSDVCHYSTNCHNYSDGGTCNADSDCDWIDPPGTCVYAGCPWYNHCLNARSQFGLTLGDFCVDNCVNSSGMCAPDNDGDGVWNDSDVEPDCATNDTDDCGVCGGDNSSCADECGVPNGDNSTCLDECGVPNGDGICCDPACACPLN